MMLEKALSISNMRERKTRKKVVAKVARAWASHAQVTVATSAHLLRLYFSLEIGMIHGPLVAQILVEKFIFSSLILHSRRQNFALPRLEFMSTVIIRGIEFDTRWWVGHGEVEFTFTNCFPGSRER